MQHTRIGIGMSGGVDSTATALILQNKYPISGFLMNVGQPNFRAVKEKATNIAARLDIEFTVIDLRDSFKAKVLEYFSTSYGGGKTPNPCIICNQAIKFGLFMEHILNSGVEMMATGHYATIEHLGDKSILRKGLDPVKDQSYFLSRLNQNQLSRLMFPLGKMRKKSVYTFVRDHGFTEFDGQESQDVCFLKDTSIGDFLEMHLNTSTQEGPILDLSGNQIGTHTGLHRYTIGQRKGLGLPDSTPWYVHSMCTDNNGLYVCKKDELFRSHLTANSAHWLSHPPADGDRLNVKIRSTDRGSAATVNVIDETRFTLHFDHPQRAIAPGQFVVLYEQDRVIGSGEILPLANHSQV
ncbi:MAG: tRNA 2-thiouridine(34) synthase MnmA [Desulfobulbaceae bacterium]|nr:MAG: tRNA 2-thiouridine(34) synthase MnmA [Desulfobulbaceae bacterium]